MFRCHWRALQEPINTTIRFFALMVCLWLERVYRIGRRAMALCRGRSKQSMCPVERNAVRCVGYRSQVGWESGLKEMQVYRGALLTPKGARGLDWHRTRAGAF